MKKLTADKGLITTYPPRTAVQPIAFCSRILATREKRYWPTEMEVLGYVWMLKKCMHWIRGTRIPPVTVFTEPYLVFRGTSTWRTRRPAV